MNKYPIISAFLICVLNVNFFYPMFMLRELRYEPYYFDHDLFTAPDVYENRIVCFILKAKYDNAQGKEEAACQLYYDCKRPGVRYIGSTHDGVEKPNTYPQFIESQFPNAKIIH